MNLRLSKEQVIERLEAMLPEAEAIDAERLAEHKVEEAAWVKEVHAFATQLKRIKNPKTMAEKIGKRHGYLPEQPACPRSEVMGLKYWISNVQRDGRKTYSLNDGGTNWRLYRRLTTPLVPVDSTVC